GQDACSTTHKLLLLLNGQDACSTTHKLLLLLNGQDACSTTHRLLIVERASCPFLKILNKFYLL
ncbi:MULTISPECIES: hypothetical protein, partial [unclassified Microcoleus]|uniref:hypothetical protein n=1 Tax=unclassified Microcoleus TaxID=2642155 RepID=UPI002FD4C72D